MNQVRRLKLYDVSTLGGRLRCARELAGMRQYELARRVGMQAKQVSEMELERMPLPYVKVAGICMSLKVTRAWLLEGAEEGGPDRSRYGILRSGQTPRQLRETTKEKWRQEAIAEAKRRNALRTSLTSSAVPTHSVGEQIPSRHRASEEAVKPSQIEQP